MSCENIAVTPEEERAFILLMEKQNKSKQRDALRNRLAVEVFPGLMKCLGMSETVARKVSYAYADILIKENDL